MYKIIYYKEGGGQLWNERIQAKWRRWEGGGEMVNDTSGSARKDLEPEEERSLCSILGFVHRTFGALMQGLGQPKLPQIPGDYLSSHRM